MIHNTIDFIYEGIFHKFFWDKSINPNADITNGLNNCTTMAYGLSLIDGIGDIDSLRPVSKIVSAGNWHRYLTNGYSFIPFDSSKAKVGDIIEWESHVAKVVSLNDGIIVGSSFYTGEHGKSIYEGKYDTRPWGTLEEMSAWMYKHYPFRMYHECTWEKESSYVGGQPTYLLIKPTVIYPVERNEEVDQIHVLTDSQNIRDNDNNIVGVAIHGYYNVLQSKISHGYIWYEVESNRYIAGVKNRVEYIPSMNDVKTQNELLKKENNELKERLRQIHNLSGD